MKCNVGKTDKIIRFLFGVVLIILAWTAFQGTASIIITVIAAIPILTALINFCPLYSLLGVSTCQHEHSD